MVRLAMDQQLSLTVELGLELETDSKDIAYTASTAHVKFHLQRFVRALGFSGDDEIIDIFGDSELVLQHHRKRYPQKSNGFTDR